MTDYKIEHLKTHKDKAPCLASTKRAWRGPATILTITYDDGGVHQIEYDYMPKATLDDLSAISQKLRDGNA